MSNSTTNNLVQTWVSVTDLDGRTCLESRWTEAPQSGAPLHVEHAA